MTPLKLTPEQDAEIVMHRSLGMTLSELADMYGVSAGTIRRALKRQGVEIGKRVERPHWGIHALDRREELEAIEAYKAGMSDADIAEVFGVSRKTIAAIRKRYSVPTRSKRQFSAKQEAEIREAYLSGMTIKELARAYGSSFPTIQRSLKRTGTELRPQGAWVAKQKSDPRPERHAIKPDDIAYLARLYREGVSLKELGELFDVAPGTITKTLARYGYERRPLRSRDPEEHLITGLEPQLIEDYLAGMTEEQLIRKYAITPREIREAIDRHLAAPMQKVGNPARLDDMLVIAGWGAFVLLGYAMLRGRR